MKIIGELVKNKILIKKPKDIGRLFNKSSAECSVKSLSSGSSFENC